MAEVSDLDGTFKSTGRSIFMGVNLFRNADEFIEFVEQTKLKDKHVSPETYAFSDEKSKFQAFIQNPITRTEINNEFIFVTFLAYRFLLNNPKIKSVFHTEQHRRFLMHFTLMLEIVPIIKKLAPHSLSLDTVESQYKYTYSTLTRRYFKHSCAPNVVLADHNGRSIFTTVRPVKKGEKLWNGLPHILLEPKIVRQITLLAIENSIDGECNCSRCQGVEATKQQRKMLAADPVYKEILTKTHLQPEYNSYMKRWAEQCETFLRKYANVEWCDEIGQVIQVYTNVLAIKLIFGTR